MASSISARPVTIVVGGSSGMGKHAAIVSVRWVTIVIVPVSIVPVSGSGVSVYSLPQKLIVVKL